MAKRLHAMGSARYSQEFNPMLHWDLVELPKRWRSSRVVFVNSMSDLFQTDVSFEFIAAVFDVMKDCPQHTFQILTKRADRLQKVASRLDWSPNIWMGVSVENERVLARVDALRRVPAAVRFLSCEPLLGPLDSLDLTGIDWVIVGGESGPGARLMHRQWAEDIQAKCKHRRVPFFFKQWGGVRKDLTGRKMHGRTYDEMPTIADGRTNDAVA